MNGKVLWCLMASVCVAQQQYANSVHRAYQHGPGSIHSLIFVHAPELVSQRCDAVWHNLWPRFPLKNQHKLGDFVRFQDTGQARPVSVSFWASNNTVDIKTSHCNYTDHRYLLALQLYIYLQKSRYKCTARRAGGISILQKQRDLKSAPFQDAFKTNGQFQNLSQPIKFLKPFYDFLICENPMPTSLTFYRIPAQPLGCSNIHLQLSNDNTVATKLKLACLDSNMHWLRQNTGS